MSSRAASWGWTTSASSTAARRCRPAGIWSSPTARAGWRCIRLNLLAIAMELACENPAYEDVASKFWEHFLYIAHAMNNMGEDGLELWDEEDGFYYDALQLPDGRNFPLKIRSMVGLIPLFAVETLEPEIAGATAWLPAPAGVVRRQPAGPDWQRGLHADPGTGRAAAAVDRGPRPAAARAEVDAGREASSCPRTASGRSRGTTGSTRSRCRSTAREHRVDYEPAESTTGLVRRQLELARADLVPGELPDHRVAPEVPPLPGRRLQGGVSHRLGPDDDAVGGRGGAVAPPVADLPARRPTASGRSTAARAKFQTDPHWRDLILFYEYFHGDNGAGIGASHQTGWTGLVAKLLQQSGE